MLIYFLYSFCDIVNGLNFFDTIQMSYFNIKRYLCVTLLTSFLFIKTTVHHDNYFDA